MSNLSNTQVKLTTCPICTKSCVMEATIEDGKVVKVKSCSNKAFAAPPLCVAGYETIPYIYHEDRIKTPLKRIGKRGEGIFQPITWDEAYREIAARLSDYKNEYGANSVVFYTGWQKWYRFMFHRLAFSFGSINFGTESSSCFLSTVMANRINSGYTSRPDLKNAGVAVIWTSNDNKQDLVAAERKRGLKVIVIDPRTSTKTQNNADIHLRVNPGTDAALAFYLAKIFIKSGFIDKEYIDKYVKGFDEYAEYVKQFDLEKTAELTGLSTDEITAAAKLIMDNAPLTIMEGNTGIIHHKNGMQTYRAINALCAITGCFDREGGIIPENPSRRHSFLPYGVLNLEFTNEKLPGDWHEMIGTGIYPLWTELNDEFQAMDLPRHFFSQKPYPLKALFALGMNARLFPHDQEMFRVLEEIDFYVDVDLFMTDSAKYADIVLPACSSLERSELIGIEGSSLAYIEPVIKPYYEAKSDMDIICELAEALNLDDDLLRSGYDNCCRYIMRELPFTLDDLKAADKPLDIGNKPYITGEHTKKGYDTPTGKYEIKSTLIESHPEWGLNALPTYTDPYDNNEIESYPFVLVSGIRLPYFFHSRLHRLSLHRRFRPETAADLNPQDAEKLGIAQSDTIEIVTAYGKITVKANLTATMRKGTVGMHHNYIEADINTITPQNHNDPYSGFPGFKSVRCTVKRV